MLECALDIHLVDGTYELFRHYYALPSARDRRDGRWPRCAESSRRSGHDQGRRHARRGRHRSRIESFRNELWPGYKTGEGIEPDLLAQFPLLEEVLSAAGIVVWPMVEFEADDALAAAATAALGMRVSSGSLSARRTRISPNVCAARASSTESPDARDH